MDPATDPLAIPAFLNRRLWAQQEAQMKHDHVTGENSDTLGRSIAGQADRKATVAAPTKFVASMEQVATVMEPTAPPPASRESAPSEPLAPEPHDGAGGEAEDAADKSQTVRVSLEVLVDGSPGFRAVSKRIDEMVEMIKRYGKPSGEVRFGRTRFPL
jgi:hypothetical protein